MFCFYAAVCSRYEIPLYSPAVAMFRPVLRDMGGAPWAVDLKIGSWCCCPLLSLVVSSRCGPLLWSPAVVSRYGHVLRSPAVVSCFSESRESTGLQIFESAATVAPI